MLTRKKESSQISNLILHIRELEKEKMKPKVSRRKEIIKIRVEINEMETRKYYKRSTKLRTGFLKR